VVAQRTHEIRILLHDIRSAHNVGAIFRTADAIGASRIYLSGYTPAPLDRFKRVNKEIAKTALGAELAISWEVIRGYLPLIPALKDEGFTVVGLEQDARSVDYKTYTPLRRTLLLLGSEVEGMDDELRAFCDALIEIPMYGAKESLNVSVAAGVALFHLFDRS
jgi:23S rRNA (guanosine2251-2'-O)-methyltransferase